MQSLAAQEAIAVSGLHERAAQGVEHVLHCLLLFRAAGVVTFVKLYTKNYCKNRMAKYCSPKFSSESIWAVDDIVLMTSRSVD